MHTFMDKAESMCFTACIPQSWWEFSVEYAVQLYNRTPQDCLKWSTPFVMLHNGEKPHVDQFRVFGCGAWVLISQETRTNKLAPKSELMTYIRQNLSGGIFMRAPNNVVFHSANAQFDETFFPKCPDNKGRKPERPKSPTKTHPEPRDDHSNDPKFDDGDAPDNSKCQRTRQHEPSHKRPSNADNGPAPSSSSGSGRSSPPQPNRDPVRSQRQAPPEQPLRRSTRVRRPVIWPGNVYGESRSPHEIIRDMENLRTWTQQVGLKEDVFPSNPPSRAGSAAPDTPRTSCPLTPRNDAGPSSSGIRVNSDSDNEHDRTFNTAPSDDDMALLCREGGVKFLQLLLSKADKLDGPIKPNIRDWAFRDLARLSKSEQAEWKHACQKQLEVLRQHNVFKLVDKPKCKHVVKNRWVFDVKPDGRKQARLVARGFSQIEGVDFNQIFSPVVRYKTVQLICALAALKKWHMSALDMRNAYLYGELSEEIYMEQPEGYKAPSKEHKVLRLNKALYGLKQAGLTWWHTLDRSIKDLGFRRLVSDAGLFIKYNNGKRIIVVVYVNNALFCGPNKAKVLKAK
jgi:hypothetical protein